MEEHIISDAPVLQSKDTILYTARLEIRPIRHLDALVSEGPSLLFPLLNKIKHQCGAQ